jgi:glycosyltransferase involved in cell wall biosynthesis
MLTTGASLGELDVVVVCNGCTDNTVAIAENFGPPVRVIETDVANKAHALNLGDQACFSFPRIYVDADVVIRISGIRRLKECLEKGDVAAAAPTAYFELSGCSWPVRAFYKVRRRLPSSSEGIGGSGVYALSESGRSRFGTFPNLVADDMYVRLQFKPKERATLTSVRSVVFAPRTIKSLVAIEARADFGTRELELGHPGLWINKGHNNQAALLGLLRNPLLWPQLFVYCLVRATARRQASALLSNSAFVWKRDETSRDTEMRPDPPCHYD